MTIQFLQFFGKKSKNLDGKLYELTILPDLFVSWGGGKWQVQIGWLFWRLYIAK